MVFEVAIGVLGGLLLFLFGVNRLSDTLMDRMGNQAKSILARFTSNVFTAILTGTFVTVLLDSSAAAIVLAIVLVKQNLLSLTGAIAIMLGAELGTCGSSLLATIHGSRSVLKTGIFHFLFNATFIALGLLLFDPFAFSMERISAGMEPARQLALAHFGFNALSVTVVAPFVPLIERLLNWGLPEKD